jgi:alanine racemase
MPPDAGYRSWVEISIGQIGANFDAVRQAVGEGVETVPVVKANACGHGAVPVSRFLTERGARWLAVASAEEGAMLRASGISARILVMADSVDRRLFDYNLTPVIHSLQGIQEWDKQLRENFPKTDGRYHLKIDTGLWRLGTRASADEIAAAVRACVRARLEGLMTHFASAGDYASSQTDDQTGRFLEMSDQLSARGITTDYRHLSGTVAVAYRGKVAWQNMVRTAHAIYGYIAPASGPGVPAPILAVKPALAWKARILEVKEVPEGEAIGYRGTFRTAGRMRIAILAAGYADGIPHQLANRGKVIAAGKITRMVGAIAMDMTAVDITHAAHLKPGDAVTLLGREGDASLDAQQIGHLAETSSYAILCGIGARVARVYIE